MGKKKKKKAIKYALLEPVGTGTTKNMERSTDGGGRPMEVAFGGMLLYGT